MKMKKRPSRFDKIALLKAIERANKLKKQGKKINVIFDLHRGWIAAELVSEVELAEGGSK